MEQLSVDELTVKRFQDLTYFDNLALHYLCNETPPKTLALSFLAGDEKVVGSMLGVLDPKRREFVHKLMAEFSESDEASRKAALHGVLCIAENLLLRNLIEKKGKFFFGTQKSVEA
ncbi:MAG: hypothetical protein SFU98_20395 [Leptospiraceae bacterium]|nr:hypothetical protein [Leptospiraceae bacterium]